MSDSGARTEEPSHAETFLLDPPSLDDESDGDGCVSTIPGIGSCPPAQWGPYAGQLLTPKKQGVEFDDVPTGTPLRDVYDELTAGKRKRIVGDDGSGYMEKSKHRAKLQDARQTARREQRDEHIRALANHPECELSQRAIGEVFGISQQHAWRISNDGEE